MNPNRVLLLTLSERTSAKGNAYLSGWLGKASVVAFRGGDDKHGNPTWDLFVSTPELRPEQPRTDQRPPPLDRAPPAGGRAERNTTPGSASAKPTARPVERSDGWCGRGRSRRPANGARRAPLADDGAF